MNHKKPEGDVHSDSRFGLQNDAAHNEQNHENRQEEPARQIGEDFLDNQDEEEIPGRLPSGTIAGVDKEFWQEAPNEEQKKKQKSWWSVVKETLTIIVTALVIAFLLKNFIIDTRVVPTLSMFPTVYAGDRVIISKLSYWGESTPERGDIVVFKPPAELGSDDDLLKRIIGLPGESLEIKEGLVFIDGQALPEDYLHEAPNYIFGPVEIPAGHYFMMGDNRNQSVDSHAWKEPFIPQEALIGKVLVRYWPLDRLGKLDH